MRIFFEDIQISFGLDKCAVLKMKRGGQVDRTGRELPDDRQIGEVETSWNPTARPDTKQQNEG